MEKLSMCRICLVQNVRMFVVVNRTLRELYEKLTDTPFVTEDRRPILACFFCCTKLKQCYRLLRQCLEAEELFAQMMNEDYVPHPEFYSGFIKSPTENISIVDEYETERIAIKEELPAVGEGLDDIIESKEDHESDAIEPEIFDNSCQDVADITPHHCKSDSQDDVPIMEYKIEVEEEQDVSKRKQRTRETKKATVAKKPKVEKRRTKLEDVMSTAEQTKIGKSGSIFIRTTQKCTSKPDQHSFNRGNKNAKHARSHAGENPFKCDVCQRSFKSKHILSRHILIHTGEKAYKCDVCQRSFNQKTHLSQHNRTHTGEKPYKCDVCQRTFSEKGSLTKHSRIHTGEKPYKCVVCQRSFSQKVNLSRHIRIHTVEKSYKCDVRPCSYCETGS